MSRIASLLALGALAATGGIAHAATAVTASMSLGTWAEVGGAIDTSTSSDLWGVPLTPLSIGAFASASDPLDGARTASAFGYGNAAWAGADSGTVSFEGFGWAVDAIGASSAAVSLTNAQPDWSYSFVAGAGDTQINVAYDVFGSGDGFGLWGWSIVVTGGPQAVQALYANNPLDPTASGLFSASLTPGESYIVSLVNNANVANADTGFALSGQMNGSFSWEIVSAPVPEPGTWGLMALGLLAVGRAARRRRA